MTDEELGIQLEEWEASEEKQDGPPVSAMEDSLLFESKDLSLCKPLLDDSTVTGIIQIQTCTE